ncbi:hypothetical protein JG687_00012219 [Phytophthora cactorum]|uniref:Uncharacterized protein n=1 Tax=Phytophthora cactorum TaxID=29920 RepID=A0A8T1U2K6_9STRA|nr:hypothetical protein JG687_00012219 [Phytophthora cactorum]
MNGFNYEMMATLGVITTSKFYLEARISLIQSTTAVKKSYQPAETIRFAGCSRCCSVKAETDREALEASAKPLEATNSVLKVRKRIAAMVCNATNRQEVAGPFAALYLFRGSCCYLSAARVSLHMYNRIR